MCSGFSDDAFECQKRLRHRLERSTMDWTRPEFMKLRQVQFGTVTFVLAETILRKFSAKVSHHHVPCDFRDHTGGRDAEAVTVAVNDRSLRKRKGNDRPSVNEHVVGRPA